MKPLNEIALEVAADIWTDTVWNHDEIKAFAHALVDRLTRDAEPVAWIDRTKLQEKGMRYATGFKATKYQSPVFLHPPFTQQPVIDKSMLKRLVTQVFGDEYEITRRGVSEWQPIETAPKDGTCILIYTQYSDTGEFYVAGYDSVFSAPWRLINDFGFNEHVPTHWMPLPAAPKGGSK